MDEAHERSLNIDFLLGYLRLLRRKRPDLKIVITSATIDTETFSRAFDDAPVIEVSGRMFPVEVRYWPLDEILQDRGDYTYLDAAASAVDEILRTSREGDLLVFLPSERDIRETRERLEGRKLRGVEILPLFGRLTAGEQQRVFAPGDRRRVVLATNIAETSLTIPRIHYVVDTGLARLSRYNPRTHTQRLPIEPISQSSARQREGRCGRVADGVCIRLYSEQDFLSRPEYTQPEIQRANLAEVILRMINLKLGDIEAFPFIDPPAKAAIAGGFQLLSQLNALDENRALTPIGRAMARLPIDPTVSRMLLQAREEQALSEVLVIAAAISIQDPRERPLEEQDAADQMHRQFHDKNSDFLAYLNIWNAYHDKVESCLAEPTAQILQGALPLLHADARMARHPRADPRNPGRDKRLPLQPRTRRVRRDPSRGTHRPAFECGASRGGQYLSGSAQPRGDDFSRLGTLPPQQGQEASRGQRPSRLASRGRDRRDLAPVRPHCRPHPARMAR